MGKHVSTKLISTNLPLTDKYFPFQLLSFFSILSSIFPNLYSLISCSALDFLNIERGRTLCRNQIVVHIVAPHLLLD
jgi:hypothetical protein